MRASRANRAATRDHSLAAGEALPYGPVETLCKEIGFLFDRRLERADVLVSFVRELVGEIEDRRETAQHIARFTGQEPTEGSAEALSFARLMLEGVGEADLRKRAKAVHDACWWLNQEGAYPTDHLIDMVSSCASAIRFGLERPCRSRHAAEAADHVWKQKYGISLFDGATGEWSKAWARQKFQAALIALLPPETPAPGDCEGHGTEQPPVVPQPREAK